MSIPLITLGALGAIGTYYGLKKANKQDIVTNCFLDKLATPLRNLFIEYHSNSLFLVDSVREDCVIVNTPFKELYGVQIIGNETIQKHVSKNTMEDLIKMVKDDERSFFFYCIHKENDYQRTYIFSHNKLIVTKFANEFGTKLMSGIELLNTLSNQFLNNSYYIKDKQIQPAMTISKTHIEEEQEFVTFKKIAKQAIANNYNNITLFQANRHIGIAESDITELFKLNFRGSIWFYIDLGEKHIVNHISRLINFSKLVGDKRPFIDLNERYKNKEFNLAVVNAIAYLKEYDESIIGSLGNCLKVNFIQKPLFKNKHLQKMPIKYRDSEFDFLVTSDFLSNFIANVHKRSCKFPDIYGVDKNNAFINYSFSEENDNPHMCIIAKSGSGKSVSTQKIISQIIGLNFKTGECHNLGNIPFKARIRCYDIGYSYEKLVELVKGYTKNSVSHIASDFADFSYNLANLDNTNQKLFEADMQFNIDLISIILETQNASPLDIAETALLKTIFREIYSNREYQRYRIMDLEKDSELYSELIELGYNELTYLQDIEEKEYDFLRKPLLKDLVKLAKKQSASTLLKEQDRQSLSSLASKLDSIDKLDIFSKFDKTNITDSDFISMDLNNFKESSLFPAIFLSIFQKIYLKDRENALYWKRQNKPAPKLFYAIEEAKNYFRIPHFTTMFEKMALEARKYNVHLCFIVQNADHIPQGILKNLDTRIFLLRPDKKYEVIKEAKDNLEIPKNVEIGLLNTEKYEMCIWYSSGVFNMKFDIPKEEMDLFSTNPNMVA